MSSARDVVRGLAEATLVRTGVAGFARRRMRGRSVVLAYHNVVPTGEGVSGERSLHVTQRRFGQHLDRITSVARVVPLASLFDDDAPFDVCRVAITFDDAYHGAVTAGLEELRRRSLPATVFVAPGLLGDETWWDRLAEAHGGTIPQEARRHAIEELRGDRDDVLSWFRSRGSASASGGILPRIADESDLRRAASQQGITFGSHSWSHRNLSALSGDVLAAELEPPLSWLRARYANTIAWMAYPYGLSSSAVERAAAASSLRGSFKVNGGWMLERCQPSHALPRLSVPSGLSANGLSLRLSGIASNR